MARDPNLANLRPTDDDLTDDGRYFHDSCCDLTQCGHGDTGEYSNRDDGKLIQFLWNGWRSGALVLAEPNS